MIWKVKIGLPTGNIESRLVASEDDPIDDDCLMVRLKGMETVNDIVPTFPAIRFISITPLFKHMEDLVPLILEYREYIGDIEEPLDGDSIENLMKHIKHYVQEHEGDIDE